MRARLDNLGELINALYAPVYALFSPTDKDYRPDAYHVRVWYVIATILSVGLLLCDFAGWSETKWGHLCAASSDDTGGGIKIRCGSEMRERMQRPAHMKKLTSLAQFDPEDVQILH
jgi:hypothetical protein